MTLSACKPVSSSRFVTVHEAKKNNKAGPVDHELSVFSVSSQLTQYQHGGRLCLGLTS